MTGDTVRHLAQQDPTPQMVARFGDEQMIARTRLEALVSSLRRLDEIAESLAEQNITVSVDLGPIGNAAAAARRDLEKRNNDLTFQLPR